MSGLPWWKSGVIYQIAVPSFADSDGDGMGDLRGIIERLDYLCGDSPDSLGVDGLWLTPLNASPMRDFGYDVSDYYTLNPRLGTIEDLEELLDTCHRRGVKVMMDLALNHTSDEHPWFAESRSSRDNPKRDWYVWRDGAAPKRPPNRWIAIAEGSAWEYDETTNQYYYHAFLPFQPDLNWRNPAVREEMRKVVCHWFDEGVDGFRLDLVNHLYEDELLRDNPRKFGLRPYNMQHHPYDRSRPESLAEASELRRIADRYPARALMGEVCTDVREDAVAFLGDGTDALHLSFYLDFARCSWSARSFRSSVDWLEAHLPRDAWPCYYLNNHDLPRTYSRFGWGANAGARARVAAAMLLTLRGTPILYYGEEIGMPASLIPRRRMNDPLGRKSWPLSVSRDSSRTPMQWDSGPGAGFTHGEPWLPVDASHTTRNVEHEQSDPGSLLTWYRSLLSLRRNTPALQAGTYRALDDAPRAIFAYMREAGDQRIVVALNFAARARDFAVPKMAVPNAAWTTLLSTHRETGAAVGPGPLRLHPNEAIVLEATS